MITQSPSQPSLLLSDATLLETAIRYGTQARLWRNKFLGLLPEINRRKLYEKHNCKSIFEFAKKVAGVSENQVRTVLRLEKRFANAPMLQKTLITGEASINKLARVASIANKNNESDLVEKIKLLPQKTLETYVRDVRVTQKTTETSMKTKPESVRAQTFQLHEETTKALQKLHEKGIDIDEIIMKAVRQREQEIEGEKEKIAATQNAQTSKNGSSAQKPSRYIPTRIKKLLAKEHGTKCSIQNCSRPSREIHHTRRFALDGSHDPHYLAPLCKQHHQIAHSIDIRFHEMRKRNT